MRERRFQRESREKLIEDFVYILDYLPYGYGPSSRRGFSSKPMAQAIGEKYFMLLELRLIEGLELKIGEKLPLIGGLESELLKVCRRLSYDELTATAKAELPSIIKNIVLSREEEFVKFFNEAQPLTTKMHSLELLHGIGKKTLWKILNERKRKPFSSFKDIYERTKIDPLKLVVERIIEELSEEQKHYLFVKPYRRRPRF